MEEERKKAPPMKMFSFGRKQSLFAEGRRENSLEDPILLSAINMPFGSDQGTPHYEEWDKRILKRMTSTSPLLSSGTSSKCPYNHSLFILILSIVFLFPPPPSILKEHYSKTSI